MADDELNADELQTLLSARASTSAKAGDSARQPAKRPPHRSLARAQRPLLRPRADDELLRAVTVLHECCAGTFAAELSSLLRRAAQVKLAAVSQYKRGGFSRNRTPLA